MPKYAGGREWSDHGRADSVVARCDVSIIVQWSATRQARRQPIRFDLGIRTHAKADDKQEPYANQSLHKLIQHTVITPETVQALKAVRLLLAAQAAQAIRVLVTVTPKQSRQ